MSVTANSPATLQLHLLDMGTEKYGDCLLVQRGGRSILIDGAHASDWKTRSGMTSIPDQLCGILGHAAPFQFDLLVVTHCHADHIGCLPTLIANGDLKATWALVADEKLGFGRTPDFVLPLVPGQADLFAAAMREEDHSDLANDEVQQFLQDAASLEQRYNAMLAALAAAGTSIVRYGRDDHSGVEAAFRDFGLTILGPTRDHLAICAEAIANFNDAASEASDAAVSTQSLVDWYRGLISASDADAAGEDRPGKGAALNNQSIVMKLSDGKNTVLLAGDMQFAQPEIASLEPLMKALRQVVKRAGPYTFVKLTHHSSYNGTDDSVLSEWSATKSFAHTGGSNDPGHPDSGVLKLLEAHSQEIQWARTDRNGLIGVDFAHNAAQLEVEKGELNDASPNQAASRLGGLVSTPAAGDTNAVVASAGVLPGVTEVSFSVKLDPTVSRLSVTFDVQRTQPHPPLPSPDPQPSIVPTPAKVIPPSRPLLATSSETFVLAPGRKLPPLLFLTHLGNLSNNLGSSEAQAVIAAIRSAGQTIYQVSDATDPYPEVRAQLKIAAKPYEGVVIVGGYDVLPSIRLDVLPTSLRQTLGNRTGDADNFIVWNDEAYGDRDGDMQPELPMSRIPDARSPRLVKAALAAGLAGAPPTRFGIRNSARSFAAPIFNGLPGTGNLFTSAPDGPSDVGAGNANAGGVYVMLHGSDVDGTRFWGEDAGSMVEGLNVSNVPASFQGIAFAGCCWGALTVDSIASQTIAGTPPPVRTPGASMALSWLHAGARAFVGCTGSHYSPTLAPYNYFGGPLHVAFWQRYTNGEAPAKALFNAKLDFLSGMPHGQTTPNGTGIELKILKQFTCLGLGW